MKYAGIIFLFIFNGPLSGQLINTQYALTFGVNVNLNFNVSDLTSKETFPGIKAFVGFNISSRFEAFETEGGIVNLSTGLGIYNKSLGNSLNLGFQDNQIDWTTTIALGALWGEKSHKKVLQSINNLPYYNLRHDGFGASLIGVNFIMNNYLRNQTTGFVSLTYDNFSLTYYNDGGPVIGWLGLGDKFDRFWTGGLNLFWHQNPGGLEEGEAFIPYNLGEFTFDQFTGYSNQMYELSGLFGIDVQDYDVYRESNNEDDLHISIRPPNRIGARRSTGFSFNASSYQVKYFWGPNLGVSAGVLGSLRGYRTGRAYGMQDWLHIMRGDPVHPSQEKNRLFFGFNYYGAIWNE